MPFYLFVAVSNILTPKKLRHSTKHRMAFMAHPLKPRRRNGTSLAEPKTRTKASRTRRMERSLFKPDIFGRTKTEIKNKDGQVTGTIVTKKPNIFGRFKKYFKNKSGHKVGISITEKFDIFGNLKLL